MTSLVVIMDFLPCPSYILVVCVLDSLWPLSEINALFHFLIHLLHLEKYTMLCAVTYVIVKH